MKGKIGKVLWILILLVIGRNGYGITFTEDFSSNKKIDTANTTAVVNTNLKRTTLSPSSSELIFEDIQTQLVGFGTDTVSCVGYNGSYWLIGGSTTGKLNKYDGTTWTDLTSSIGFGSNPSDGDIHAIVWNGSYWLIGGGYGGGSRLFKYDGTTFTNIDASAGFPGGATIRSIKWNGTYWLMGGNSARLARYDGTTVTDLMGAAGFTAAEHNLWAVGWNGSYWLIGAGGASGKLVKYDGTTFTDLTAGWGGSTADVYTTEWNGTYWLVGGGSFGSSQRLRKYDGTTWTNLTSSLVGFGTNLVSSATWNSDYSYWLIGGYSGGATVLNRYDGNSFTNITSSLTNVSSSMGIWSNLSGNTWLIYGLGSPRSLNKGFHPYAVNNILQSQKINDISENVVSGTLTSESTLNAGSISYELSADAGAHWETVTAGTSHTFKYPGKDLRYKITVTSSSDRKATPVLTKVSINYKTESKRIKAGERGEVLSDDDIETKMNIPENSIPKTLVYSIERAISPSKIEGVEIVLSYNFEAREPDTNKIVQNLEGEVEITIHYRSSDGIKIYNADGKEIALLSEAKEKLGIGFYNGRYWVPITSEVIINNSDVYVKSRVSHLSEYGIIRKVSQSIDANVSPNPFTPRAGQYNVVHFTFNNENNEYVELKIWDITGRLVKTITGYGTSSMSWDGKDENGEYVEGGAYIYQLKVGNDKVKRGTVVVAY